MLSVLNDVVLLNVVAPFWKGSNKTWSSKAHSILKSIFQIMFKKLVGALDD
jgi:hypothetical protein